MQQAGWKQDYEKLPLLDSFLKESARLNPLDGSKGICQFPGVHSDISAVSIPRKALSTSHLSDGTHVPQGAFVGVPQHAMMTDDNIYTSAKTFDAYRFVTKKDGALVSKSKLTHLSWDFPFWGAVGRGWYAFSSTMRLLRHQVFEKANRHTAQPGSTQQGC